MNIRAARFIQRVRGLQPSERIVLQNIACHADQKNAIATMSMTTLAEESGIKNRETASRIVKRLEENYGIIRAVSGTHSKGGSGQTTAFQFTFTVKPGSGLTVEGDPETVTRTVTLPQKETVTPRVTLITDGTVTPGSQNCDFGTHGTVTPATETVTPRSHTKVLKVKEKEDHHHRGDDENLSSQPKSLKPKTIAWMRSRILHRISKPNEVENMEAYLATSIAKMNLPAEVEAWLQPEASRRLCTATRQTGKLDEPQILIVWKPIAEELRHLAQKNSLPCDDEMLLRIVARIAADHPDICFDGDALLLTKRHRCRDCDALFFFAEDLKIHRGRDRNPIVPMCPRVADELAREATYEISAKEEAELRTLARQYEWRKSQVDLVLREDYKVTCVRELKRDQYVRFTEYIKSGYSPAYPDS